MFPFISRPTVATSKSATPIDNENHFHIFCIINFKTEKQFYKKTFLTREVNDNITGNLKVALAVTY